MLEAQALSNAIQHFAHRIKGQLAIVYTDNAALLGAMKKKYSKSYRLNREVQNIYAAASAIRMRPTVFWVPTAQNPADRCSRLEGGMREKRQAAAIPPFECSVDG